MDKNTFNYKLVIRSFADSQGTNLITQHLRIKKEKTKLQPKKSASFWSFQPQHEACKSFLKFQSI